MYNLDEKAGGDQVISLADFAKGIGVSRRTLYRMIDRGEIMKPTKRGNRSYYLESYLVSYFETFKSQTA